MDRPRTPRENSRHPGLETALERLGDRWSLQLVDALLGGPLRFTDLRRELPQIASNVLTERLRRLEDEGVLVSEAYSRRPPRAEYRLSPDGERLAGAIAALSGWSEPGEEQRRPRHGRCGSEMERRWYCPACDEVDAPDALIGVDGVDGADGADGDVVYA